MLAFGLSILLLLSGCHSRYWRADFHLPTEYANINPDEPFLKVHVKGGEVYVLGSWSIDEAAETIRGSGIRYDIDRNVVSKGEAAIDFEDVALLETNVPERVTQEQFAVLGILTGVSTFVTGYCLVNPKACFGSCPTFYVVNDSERPALVAEGFSGAVNRTLERRDVDALHGVHIPSDSLTLSMTNEALETHLVKRVNVVAVPKPPESDGVFRAAQGYYPAYELTPPTECVSETGDCLTAVRELDGREYFSRTDPADLGAHEIIELSFRNLPPNTGIVIAARNSFVTTFLYYQALAYMGSSAGEWMVALERVATVNPDWNDRRVARLIEDDIEVLVANEDGKWIQANGFTEVGPIARDVQLVPVPTNAERQDSRIRLRLVRGFWKLDYVAAGSLGNRIETVTIEPESVTALGAVDEAALRRLRSEDEYLVTYPGDEYRIHFPLPAGGHEYFLETRGYYYEWIRQEWLAEQSPVKLISMLRRPERALRRLAPEYKEIEAEMERAFWQSKFVAQ